MNKIRIDLDEFMPSAEFSNKEQARRIMIKEVNFSMHPGAETGKALRRAKPGDLCYWYCTPERHQAYSTFWLYATVLNGVANAFIWFYF